MISLEEIIKNGERDNVEFKEFLSRDIHLKKDKFFGLASQMKYRVLQGNGRALYLIGVSDDGSIVGLSKENLEESLHVLKKIVEYLNLRFKEKKIIKFNKKLVALVVIEKNIEKEHLIVGTAGHVDHGKSTLVGTLISGILDDGRGKTRLFLDTQKHEIERGLSADLSYAVYGFKSDGRVIRLRNPMNKKEKAKIVEEADKLISFVDTVGHEPWLRTTIRGIVGQRLDYGLLCIACDDGITHITKEHLGLMLAMELPVIIALTKIDKVDEKRRREVEKEIERLLSIVGKIPKFIRSREDIETLPSFWETRTIIPVIGVSSKTGEGLELLDRLFYIIPKRITNHEVKKDFLMYIDKIYKVEGVGRVVSGSIKQGTVKSGDKLYIGPVSNGEFREVRAGSIEVHHLRTDMAKAGEIVGIAVKGLDFEPRRGMILTKIKNLKAVWEFEAEIIVLNHPTKITKGYEPVVHLETIAEAATVEPLDSEFLAAGDKGRVKMKFKYHPYYITEGQKFVFREGKTKGIGIVTKVL